MELLQSAGLHNPENLDLHHFSRRMSEFETKPLSDLFPTLKAGDLLTNKKDLPDIFRLYWDKARADQFHLY